MYSAVGRLTGNVNGLATGKAGEVRGLLHRVRTTMQTSASVTGFDEGTDSPSARVKRRRTAARYFSGAAGVLSILLGCTVLLGWALDSPRLKGAIGTPITMKANTALCFVLMGLSLWLLTPAAGTTLRRAAGRLLAGLAMLIGGATLAEHLFHVNLGIDQILFHEPLGEMATYSPNRMGPPASFSFLLIGAAALLMDRRRLWPVVQTVACVTAFVALLPTAGYAYGSQSLYSLERLTGIAWPTAIMLFLLSLGLIAARPDRGIMTLLCADDVGGMVVRRLLVPAMAAPFLVGWVVALGPQGQVFDSPFAHALLAVLLMVFFAAFLLYEGMALSRVAQGRDVAEVNLRQQLALTREAEERFRLLADSAPVMIWLTDDRGRIIFVNQGYRAFFDLSEEALEGTHWEPPLHSEDRAAYLEGYVQSVRNRGAFRDESRQRRADGAWRWIASHAQPRFDAAGRFLGLVGSSTDITEAKENELQRERLLDSERAARMELERAARLKDDFLANVSHELRTPLNGVLGWAQLLRRPARDEATLRQGLDAIEQGAKALAQLIEDLLDLSRIASGKVRLDVRTVDLPRVVEAALDAVRPAAEAKRIRLERVLDPAAGPVKGDPSRLQQVFWNLLSNAVKFTPSEGKVQVLLERVNSHVRVSVADTGTGIRAEFLGQIFERFKQADSGTTRRHGGLGIGLAIVRQIVEMHGGTVGVESDGEGKGATFWVNLPIAVVRGAAAGDEAAEPAGLALGDDSALSGVRVLVVDDDASSSEILRRLLSEHGAAVETVASGGEALERLASERPDVMVSDIGMPEIDGYELIRSVRQAGHTMPAVAVTAFARAEDRIRALQAGYNMHVAKPVDPRELLTVVQTLVPRSVQDGRPS